MRAALERWLLARWFGGPGALWLLVPLEWLYRGALVLRGRPPATRPPVPVIVVGNLAVGGSGKTPLVLALVAALRDRGIRAGVLSRGYGGRGPFPLIVTADTDPAACGDEPALIARRAGVPVAVAPDRRAALALLFAEGVEVVVSDDGLQNVALQRTLEIAVIDGRRGLGNGHCLPVGPLREPAGRLQHTEFVVVNGGQGVPPGLPRAPDAAMLLHPVRFRRVGNPGETRDIADLRGRARDRKVAAVAGIGDPARFFATLQALGFAVDGRAFPDHHAYTAADLAPHAAHLLLMTEKDAVKCAAMPGISALDAWYLEVEAQLPGGFVERVFVAAGVGKGPVARSEA